MKVKLNLIRHAKTDGNLEGRYVGKTDEGLAEEGVEQLKEFVAKGLYPEVQSVFVSPMKRCKQTARIIYPKANPQIIVGLEETDFGIFEYKNYEELMHDSFYQEWIDSNGTLPIPGAENPGHMRIRLRRAFGKMMQACEEQHIESAACIVHGGVIMEIMQAFGYPKKDYYDWQVKNCCGFAAEVEIEDGNFVIRFSNWIRP